MLENLKGFGMEKLAAMMGINEGNAFQKLGPLLAPVAQAMSQPKVAAWLQIINAKNLHPGESHCAFVTFERDGKVLTQLYAFTGEGLITRKLGHPMEMDAFIMGLLNADFNISKPKQDANDNVPITNHETIEPETAQTFDPTHQITETENLTNDKE